MFAEACRKFWGLLIIGQWLVFVRKWRLRFFWGSIHVGQLPIAPFCLAHTIMFWFCARLRVAASLYCWTCVTAISVSKYAWIRSQFGSECGSCFVLVCLHVGLNFGLNFDRSWACNVDLSGVDCCLNWSALVWGLNFGLKSWSECWFEIGQHLAQNPVLQGGFGSLNLTRIRSVFGPKFVWNFSVKFRIECGLISLKVGLNARLNFGFNFGLRLVSRFVCGKNWHKRFAPCVCQIWHQLLGRVLNKRHWNTILWGFKKRVNLEISAIDVHLESIKKNFITFPPPNLQNIRRTNPQYYNSVDWPSKIFIPKS